MKSARLTKKEKADLQRLREYFAIRKQTLPDEPPIRSQE